MGRWRADHHTSANSPGARITSIDRTASSLAQAQEAAAAANLTNVEFRQADIFGLPYGKESFDHIFVCFVLEHLADPRAALAALCGVLRLGGTITVIEGDHGSAFFYPDGKAARKAIRCLIELQRRAGGNGMIGRELYALLTAAGFSDVRVSRRMVYVDSSRPELVEGFTKNTFTAMIEGVRTPALQAGLAEAEAFDQGIRDLYATSGPSGAFSYTFFKAIASFRAA